jgi:hypothetical protein
MAPVHALSLLLIVPNTRVSEGLGFGRRNVYSRILIYSDLSATNVRKILRAIGNLLRLAARGAAESEAWCGVQTPSALPKRLRNL